MERVMELLMEIVEYKKFRKDALETADFIVNLEKEELNILKELFEILDVEMEDEYDYIYYIADNLDSLLEEIKEKYDYIIIDCQPSLGISTMNALVASNSVIIPVQCEYFALEGITQLLNSIILVQSNMNPDLRIEGVLLTMLDGRTNIGLEIIEEVRKCFKSKVFNTIIPRLVRLVEAPSHGKPTSDYDPTSRATHAYKNLAKEVISRNGD